MAKVCFYPTPPKSVFLVFNVVFAQYVIARPLVGRGTPEDWSTTAYAAAPPIIAG